MSKINKLIEEVQEYLDKIDKKILGVCFSRGINFNDIKPHWEEIKNKYREDD